MAQLTDIVAVVVAALNLLAGALGAHAWWYGEAGPAFWRAVRAGQLATTRRPRSPASCSSRATTPRMTCSTSTWCFRSWSRSSPSSCGSHPRRRSSTSASSRTRRPCGALPEEEQMAIVRAIMRREAGVMTIAALVIAFLALRVLGTA